jgi:hypothetical protein
MFGFLRRLFADPRAGWLRSVTDPVLGELRLSEEADWWEGRVSVGSRMIDFNIGGDTKPDAALIEHAHDIVRSYADFERAVQEFLANEAANVKHPRPCAEEISQLEIEDVCLLRPSTPDNGMIYFKGPNEYRLWRCDYFDRKPRFLGFDD